MLKPSWAEPYYLLPLLHDNYSLAGPVIARPVPQPPRHAVRASTDRTIRPKTLLSGTPS